VRAETKKQVRAFLGMAGYYSRFMTSPLTDLDQKGTSDLVQWTEQCQKAFERVKKSLCGEPLLFTPNFELPFVLQTDVSNRGLGAVFSQEVEGVDSPVLSLSRKLEEREERYSMVEYDRCPPLRPPGTCLHPLLGPRSSPLAPPHEGHQLADHAVVFGATAVQLQGGS